MKLRHALMGTAALAVIATPAFAQVADEIIVTATKREQTLQEVPVAVTVTPAETIERAQILDIADLSSVVPALRVSQNQNSQQTTFSIRGFGSGGNNVGIEPSVGVFVDGVYRSRAAAQIGDLPKLERVEVLRGPQATLFGKNSSAGVISIVTAAPSFDTEGYIEGGVSNYDGKLGKAYISGPVSENVAASLGGSFITRDGYAESAIDGVPDTNDRDRYNLRGQLLFEPTDDVAFRVIADYGQIDEICCHVTNIVNGPTSALIQGLGGQLADPTDPFAYVDFADQPKANGIEDYGLSFHANVNLTDEVEMVSISSYRRNDAFYDSEVDYTSAPLIDSVAVDTLIDTFTQELRFQGVKDRFAYVVGGYLFHEEIEGQSSLDNGVGVRPYLGALSAVLGGNPGPNPFATGEATFAGFEAALGLPNGRFFRPGLSSQENYTVDNTSYSIFGNVDFDVTDRLTATLGASYIKDSKDVTFRQTENNILFSALDFAGADGAQILTAGGFQGAFPGAFQGTFGLPFTPANVGLVTSTPQGAAGFQQLQAGVLAAVQAGVAQLDLLDPAQNPLLGLSALQFTPPIVDFPNSVEDGKSNDDEITYTLRLAYDLTDDLNLYGAYSTGFKATSFNLSRDSRPTADGFRALDAAGLLPDQTAITLTRAALASGSQFGPYIGTRSAGPEESEVFEIGLKGRLGFGNFALTGFQQTIDGFQANTFQGTGFVLTNAGEQRTRGVEAELSVRPIENLTLALNGVYLDADYVDFVGAPGVTGPSDASGNKVDGVSPIRLSLGGQYDFDLSSNMDGYVRGDWQYESETDLVLNVPGKNGINEIAGFPGFTREVSTFNFAGGLGLANGVSVEAWVRNAFNDEYFQTAFPGVVQSGTFNAYPNQPRTYGMNLRYDF